MPKGVYARKSAQRKTEAKAAAPVKAPAVASLADVVTTPANELVQPEPQFSRDDFRRSIDDMDGALLRAYAKSIGIAQRDVDGLTEDRLRQNCKARIFQTIEDD